MHLKTRNINSAFRELVTLFNTGVIGNAPVQLRKATSRYGNVTMIDEPVTVSYQMPTERVLINPGRDCNPFFHLYEALWMLAGRNDVAPLAYYNSKMPEFSDDGKTFNGAYGYRWRHSCSMRPLPSTSRDQVDRYWHIDQLDLIVAHLRTKPDSRRAVLQMWNVEDDLLKIGLSCKECNGTGYHRYADFPDGSPNYSGSAACGYCNGKASRGSKDVCCNLSVMFSLRQMERLCRTAEDYELPPAVTYLDMIVTNRSNDLIWGLLGANAVQFSFLQEYMAARLGASVGWYHQITNNLHAYEATWEPAKWLAQYHNRTMFSPTLFDYDIATTVPLVQDPEAFERELPIFVERNSGGESYSPCRWSEPFLNDVAQPMCTAFRAHKESWGGGTAMWVDAIKADDWRRAAHDWLQARAAKRKLRGVDK